MKWFFVLVFVVSCQKQEVRPAANTVPEAVTQESAAVPGTGAKEEDCDEKAKQVQKVEITEETIKLGGQPDAGCTLE